MPTLADESRETPAEEGAEVSLTRHDADFATISPDVDGNGSWKDFQSEEECGFLPSPRPVAPAHRLRRLLRVTFAFLLCLTAILAIAFSFLRHLLLPEAQRVRLLLPLNGASHSRRSCESIVAALVNGYEPIIFNWNQTGDRPTQLLAKIPGVYNILHSSLIKESDIVLMIDAHDAWLQLPPSTLSRRFREFDDEVVVAVDYCYPQNPNSPTCVNAPPSPVPPEAFQKNIALRWVNSGTIIGTVAGMRRLYAQLHHLMETNTVRDDQYQFNELISQGLFALDYNFRLFLPMPHHDMAVVVRQHKAIDGQKEPLLPMEQYPPLAIVPQTGEIPAVVHFNIEKNWLHDNLFFGRLWWTRYDDVRYRHIIYERLHHGVITMADDLSTRSFAELCPAELLGSQIMNNASASASSVATVS